MIPGNMIIFGVLIAFADGPLSARGMAAG